MKTKLGTLLLLGLTVAVASVSGCIVTSSGGRGNTDDCGAYRYFFVQWEVDTGGQIFTCATTPPSHVVITTNFGDVLRVSRQCDDGYYYNWTGSTAADLPPGSYPVTVDLVEDGTEVILNSIAVPPSAQTPIGSCSSVTLSYGFPI